MGILILRNYILIVGIFNREDNRARRLRKIFNIDSVIYILEFEVFSIINSNKFLINHLMYIPSFKFETAFSAICVHSYKRTNSGNS